MKPRVAFLVKLKEKFRLTNNAFIAADAKRSANYRGQTNTFERGGLFEDKTKMLKRDGAWASLLA